MLRNKTARQHNFAITPRVDVPRSTFAMRQTRKMGFDASELIPIMCEEVIPGDTWQHTESIAARLATPIAPVVDDLHIETYYFWVPNRITDEDWEEFITGVDTNLDAAVFIPTNAAGLSCVIEPNSVLDHFGLLPQVYATPSITTFNILPLWAYFTIWNEWFRDQNLQEEWVWPANWRATSNFTSLFTQGGTAWDQAPLRINKRHDYFTASLPWPQKGSPVTIPLGTTAPVIPNGLSPVMTGGLWPGPSNSSAFSTLNASTAVQWAAGAAGTTDVTLQWSTQTGLVADLSAVSAITINALRLAAMSQQLLERDARGGSRYVENLMGHFGTTLPDYTAQRPEYLGGSKIPVTVNPIAQTAAYDAEPAATESAIGNLGAEMHASHSQRTFTFAAVEHGYIIGLAVARATPTYQQGTRKHWLRDTRLSFWWPEFANIGEQAVATREIFQTASNTYVNATWGYQERGGEYRYTPNEITGPLRSTAAQPLDWWHYAEEFAAEPALNDEFITDKTQETLARSLATAPSAQWSCQIIMDVLHESRVARLMPAYGVPGIDRF